MAHRRASRKVSYTNQILRLLQHAYPHGLTTQRIGAAFPDVSPQTRSGALRRLYEKGKVHKQLGATRYNTTWTAAQPLPDAPPLFEPVQPPEPVQTGAMLWQESTGDLDVEPAPLAQLITHSTVAIVRPLNSSPALDVAADTIRAHRAYWMCLLLLHGLTEVHTDAVATLAGRMMELSKTGRAGLKVSDVIEQAEADLLLLPKHWDAGFTWTKLARMAAKPRTMLPLESWRSLFVRRLCSSGGADEPQRINATLDKLLKARVERIGGWAVHNRLSADNPVSTAPPLYPLADLFLTDLNADIVGLWES